MTRVHSEADVYGLKKPLDPALRDGIILGSDPDQMNKNRWRNREMLTIGQMSKICGVSVKTLRHYEKIGLLRPRKTDEANGYRYYEDSQISTMLLIGRLKRYGFSLTDIHSGLAGHKGCRESFGAAEETEIPAGAADELSFRYGQGNGNPSGRV